jgi:thymidylate synthase
VTAWNPYTVDWMCLPPCHTMFQFSVRERPCMAGIGGPQARRELDCAVTMRSVDVFLGMPFDVASYALLTHIAAKELGVAPGNLVLSFGDTHVYLNHQDQCHEQLRRRPTRLPFLTLAEEAGVDDFHPDMATLRGYEPQEAIRADMNV